MPDTREVYSNLYRHNVTFEVPDMKYLASGAVYRDGKYCGSVQREYASDRDGTRAPGWTFRACGPYGNLSHAGFYSLTDAALFVAAHDDFGALIK